uniref:Uncharacterized protein n=1 Tax=Strigamia maritima TaxID=126957 RepID=T1IRB5_STRMM
MNRRNDLNFNKMTNFLGKLQDDLGIPRFKKQSTYMDPKEKNIILRNPTRNEPETKNNEDNADWEFNQHLGRCFKCR